MILLHMNHLLPQARTGNENDVLHPHSPNKLMLGVGHFMVINCWVHVRGKLLLSMKLRSVVEHEQTKMTAAAFLGHNLVIKPHL